MREYNYIIREALSVGLRKTDQNLRNQQALVQSDGMRPRDDALESLKTVTQLAIDTIIPAPVFPYPQIFQLRSLIVVGTADAIYEYNELSDELTIQLSGLTEGTGWSVADFGSFIMMANGQHLVYRDGVTKRWSASNDYGISAATSVCNFRGQVLVTAPDVLL